MRCKDCRSWNADGGKVIVRSKEAGVERFGLCEAEFTGYVPKKGKNKDQLTGKGGPTTVVLLPADGRLFTHGTFGCSFFVRGA
jgi:hypothetical protein